MRSRYLAVINCAMSRLPGIRKQMGFTFICRFYQVGGIRMSHCKGKGRGGDGGGGVYMTRKLNTELDCYVVLKCKGKDASQTPHCTGLMLRVSDALLVVSLLFCFIFFVLFYYYYFFTRYIFICHILTRSPQEPSKCKRF